MNAGLDADHKPACNCAPDCEMPCWQRSGLTDDPCGACGCASEQPTTKEESNRG